MIDTIKDQGNSRCLYKVVGLLTLSLLRRGGNCEWYFEKASTGKRVPIKLVVTQPTSKRVKRRSVIATRQKLD